MATVHQAITPELLALIERQQLFFVATAPAGPEGHINLSPKGLDTFRVLSPTRVAYLDFVGSGNETAAHVSQNGRITFMFCSFQDKPRILRLYGHARIVLPASPDWPDLAAKFPKLTAARQIFDAQITRVQTSCGMGVPTMTFDQHRTGIIDWAEKIGPDSLRNYQSKNNRTSIDGLPAPL